MQGALLGLLFASGAVALVYQVLWQRQLALHLGSAATATAAVLASFFAGLGLGSLLVGRWLPRHRHPLRVYALLELAIGWGALAVTPILLVLEPVHPWLVERLGEHPSLLVIAKAGLAFLALALPSLAMGGTLPALAQWMDHGPRRLGVHTGALYAANTAGAALGALSVPFLLLPRLGLQGSVVLAATANGLVALGAWRLASRSERPAPPRAAPLPAAPSPAGTDRGVRAATALAAVSGALTTALQVLWNRAFSQVHENSMHAFAVIATVVILALAAGAEGARRALQRQRAPRQILAFGWLAGGLLTILFPWAFHHWTGGLAYLPTVGESGLQTTRLAWLALGLIAPPTLLLGLALPALLESAGRATSEGAAALVGRLLAANIGGCVAGALAAGFVLPHVLGLWTALVAIGVGAVMLGLAHRPLPSGASSSSTAAPAMLRRLAWTVLPAAIVAALALPAAARLPRVRLATAQGERLIALTEGPHGIVAVTDRPGSRRLKLNNHYGLGGTLSVGDQRMQSHLPLLSHPQPRTLAVLGLGTGISAGGVHFHPHERVDVVELVPEVIDAARRHFSGVTPGFLEDPRTRLIPEDARQFLRTARARYDVLLGDLVVPWRQGEAALFTREHFVAARNALTPGGVFCQWIPLFQLSETEFRIALRTFLDVFPQAQVWRGDFSPTRPAVALLGTRGGPDETAGPVPAEVERRLAAMQPDPANPHLVHPTGLWMHFVGTLTAADLDPAETRVHTEDRPWIELLAPTTHAGERRSQLFVGRPLQRWLETVRARSEARQPGLGPDVWNAVRQGERLFEFSLLLQERREAEARQVRAELVRSLPSGVALGIFGAGAKTE